MIERLLSSSAVNFHLRLHFCHLQVVDGKLSQTCYLMALDSFFKSLCHKYEKFEGKKFSILDAEYFVFHSPYNKDGQRMIMFSYGSGLSATMFSLRLREGQYPFSLSNIASVMNVAEKLKSRHEFSPEKFVETMHLMEHRYGAKDFVTTKDCSLLAPGTYYLLEVLSNLRNHLNAWEFSSMSFCMIRLLSKGQAMMTIYPMWYLSVSSFQRVPWLVLMPEI